jgi:beta-1,4-mannosyltransferase
MAIIRQFTGQKVNGLRVLLIDTSEKGALPLYTAMVAQSLQRIGARPSVLANQRLVDPGLEGDWPVHRRLRAGAWPPPPGTPPMSGPQQAMRWLLIASEILWTVFAERPDVVHIQHPIHPRLDVWLVSALKRISPVVWTAHDVLPHDRSTDADARSAAIYEACSAVLVHSAPAAVEMRRISAADPIIIRHPVRELLQTPDKLEARSRLGLEPGIRLASAIGFIRSYKGYRLLADALVLAKSSDLRILIMGQLVDESERDVLDAIQADPRAIMAIGYASEKDVINAIAASDILLLPHATASDSGSLHMARALGIPVLASDAPQLASVVQMTGAGVVLPRMAERWAQALDAAFPDPPPPPPTPSDIGAEHMAAYTPVLKKRSSRV